MHTRHCKIIIVFSEGISGFLKASGIESQFTIYSKTGLKCQQVEIKTVKWLIK